MAENKVFSRSRSFFSGRGGELGIWAVFITQFVSFVFINARNIAFPVIISAFDGMRLFSWLIALPAVAGAASTLLFGKLSDIFGRRNVLLLSIGIFLAGLGISAVTKSMTGLVAAATFMSIGHFPIVPLCFTAIGDLFPPAERAKWTGMLSLPNGIAALSGPVLGGLVAESALGWRAIYWGTIPLMLIGAVLVAIGLPNRALQEKPRIDLAGTAIMVFGTTSLFVGFSWLGSADKRWLALGLLVLSLAAWITFILIEKKAAAPILDPHIFQSRPFMTAAGAGFLAYFGLLGIVSYSPIFVQNVMKIDPTINGSMLTPYYTIAAFMGIPVGLLLAKTKKFKWIYLIGYSFSTLALFVMWQFTKDTPTWLYILVTTLAGLGIGSLGTVNVLVAQFSVPKHLLGAAVGAINFFQMVGIVVAPAVLGLVQNQAADLQTGMKLIFLVGALTMLAALVLIATIPHVSIERED